MEVVIFVGNIGTGKSTLAAKYAQLGYAVTCGDAVTTMVHGGKYGYYDISKRSIYKAVEVVVVEESLKAGQSVVVDGTNINRVKRAWAVDLARAYGATLSAVDFGPGTLEGLGRRLAHSRGVSRSTWRDVWLRMRDNYESPLEGEFDNVNKAPEKYTVHAFDFDGTLSDDAYPVTGDALPLVERIKELYQDMGNVIVLWTCRHGESLDEMTEWLMERDIPYDYINENPLFETGSRKIFANFYYDDRAICVKEAPWTPETK